jgi:hypothetical protein
MKIIKYETSSNNFCLVHKTKIFIYYLFSINNKYYYFESYFSKNYRKTKKICSRMLKEQITKTSSEEYDDYLISHKATNYLTEKSDYHLVSETFGHNRYITFCAIDKNDLKSDIHLQILLRN